MRIQQTSSERVKIVSFYKRVTRRARKPWLARWEGVLVVADETGQMEWWLVTLEGIYNRRRPRCYNCRRCENCTDAIGVHPVDTIPTHHTLCWIPECPPSGFLDAVRRFQAYVVPPGQVQEPMFKLNGFRRLLDLIRAPHPIPALR